MDAWLRLVAVFAVAVVAALALKALPAAVVLAIFLGGGVLVTRSLRARVRAERPEPAAPPAPTLPPPELTPPAPADPAT